MNYLCDNTQCSCHMSISASDAKKPKVYLDGGIKVDRYMYRCDGGFFFLCDVCHNAVEMTKKLEVQHA